LIGRKGKEGGFAAPVVKYNEAQWRVYWWNGGFKEERKLFRRVLADYV
jgi:hypothetical protein